MNEGHYVYEFDGIKTLPLYILMGRTLGKIPRFASGEMSIEFKDPTYKTYSYQATPSTLNSLGSSVDDTIKAANRWGTHIGNYSYFVQFQDDDAQRLITALYNHTETLSAIADARLLIDPTPLWNKFDSLHAFAAVHSEYRADPDRDARYDHFAERLAKVHGPVAEHMTPAMRFIERFIKQCELKRETWASMDAIVRDSSPKNEGQIKLFYSYSHKDEGLRDQLQSHLSLLKRNGVISEWHDRRISAGREWEGQIDGNLKVADVVLLLISSDFLASDYCYDIEMRQAVARHECGECRVIPVILRSCDWHESLFKKLQALPKDGEPVTSWQNIDEAFTDVAKGIRMAVAEMTAKE